MAAEGSSNRLHNLHGYTRARLFGVLHRRKRRGGLRLLRRFDPLPHFTEDAEANQKPQPFGFSVRDDDAAGRDR